MMRVLARIRFAAALRPPSVRPFARLIFSLSRLRREPCPLENQTCRSPNGSPPAAFSLVELVIAVAILAVGLVGSMRVFPAGLQASRRSEMMSRAAIVAQRTIESLKLAPCGALTDERATVEGLTLTTHLAQPQLTQLVDPARLKSLETTVEWAQDGRSRALTFVTYVRCSPS
ncbi:MAG: prepilin-type N-terminal cleavage/methylation domain-containing protein [Candidatus Omnitrophica bacterium]|nr:prepilin-type N-terminal cleavage/methylation domain-containing protein [Candidatus Omnitrophota bacterium]